MALQYDQQVFGWYHEVSANVSKLSHQHVFLILVTRIASVNARDGLESVYKLSSSVVTFSSELSSVVSAAALQIKSHHSVSLFVLSNSTRTTGLFTVTYSLLHSTHPNLAGAFFGLR